MKQTTKINTLTDLASLYFGESFFRTSMDIKYAGKQVTKRKIKNKAASGI